MSLQCKENEFMNLEDSSRSAPPPAEPQSQDYNSHLPQRTWLPVLYRTSRDSPAPQQPLAAAVGASVLPEASLQSVLGSDYAQADSLCVGRQKEVIRNA